MQNSMSLKVVFVASNGDAAAIAADRATTAEGGRFAHQLRWSLRDDRVVAFEVAETLCPACLDASFQKG